MRRGSSRVANREGAWTPAAVRARPVVLGAAPPRASSPGGGRFSKQFVCGLWRPDTCLNGTHVKKSVLCCRARAFS